MMDPEPDPNAAGEGTQAYRRPPSQPPGTALVAGTLLARRYQIVAPLGKGGMGEVYRAHDTRLGRDVAIKVLPAPFASDFDRLSRFEREARAVAALTHPNILAIHDYGTDQGVTYAATELLEGQTLRERQANGPLPWREAVSIGTAIADGLAAAHARSIIHRDLKPANLFLTRDGRVKILDFGLARMGNAQAPTGAETATFKPSLTESGAIMGTVGYMSPEQVRGESADARSDLFALGCVLYEMVSGIRPFTRPTATETQAALLRDDPPPLAPAGAPPELDRLIRRCLEKDGAARFQTARELALAIIGLLDNTAATTAKTPKRRMRPGHLVPVAVLIIVAGVVVYLLVRGPADRSPGPPAGPAPIDTVAVLPFAVEGQDPEAGYLGDDITFSLTERLGRYRDLKVRPYSSTSRFKDKPAAAAGRELGVRAVLVGMIQKRGEALQVRVELIDVGEDRLLWQKQYDGKADERLVLHRNIVQDIPDQLRFTLTGEQKRDLAKLPTQSTKAHELYVRGRLEWNKRTVEGLERAIRYFQDALASDPNYALAHSGLADCYVLAPGLGICTPGEGYRQAKDAALKALQLDPTLAEA